MSQKPLPLCSPMFLCSPVFLCLLMFCALAPQSLAGDMYVNPSAGYIIMNDSTADGNVMTIKSDGNVGIGTTGPSSILHVSPASDNHEVIMVNRGTLLTQYGLMSYYGGSFTFDAVDKLAGFPNMSFNLSTDGSTFNQVMGINYQGNVSVPLGTLTVSGTGSSCGNRQSLDSKPKGRWDSYRL